MEKGTILYTLCYSVEFNIIVIISRIKLKIDILLIFYEFYGKIYYIPDIYLVHKPLISKTINCIGYRYVQYPLEYMKCDTETIYNMDIRYYQKV